MMLSPSQKLITTFHPASLAAVLLLTALFLLFLPPVQGPAGLTLRLPVEKQPASSGDITLTLSGRGDLLLNHDRVTLQTLGKQLADRFARTGDSVVVVRADRDVRFHQTARVLEIARNAGASRVIISNQSASGP